MVGGQDQTGTAGPGQAQKPTLYASRGLHCYKPHQQRLEEADLQDSGRHSAAAPWLVHSRALKLGRKLEELNQESGKLPTDYINYRTGQELSGFLGVTIMDSPDYGIAAMRRGSYDDAAASLRPVSKDLTNGERDPVGDDR